VPSPAPAPGPLPSGHVATMDASAACGFSALGSTSAPSGLMTSASRTLPGVPEEYESDDNYRWAGDEGGLDYGDVTKSKSPFTGYMLSCNHSQIISTPSLAYSSMTCISLPQTLLTAIWSLCKTLICDLSQASGFVVADTGTSDHMLPDILVFNSYKRVNDLSVRMGNNSIVPVLGPGTAVFSLNGK
jgi:hypothetical protein